MPSITWFDKPLIMQYSAAGMQTITGTTGETSMLAPGVGTPIIPAGWFSPGRSVRVISRGLVSTVLTAGTSTGRVKLNNTTVASATTSGLLGGQSNAIFSFVCTIQCYTVGPTGTVGISGQMNHPASLLGLMGTAPLLTTVPNSPVSIDTTIDQTIGLTYSTTVSLNNLSIATSTVELLAQ